MQELMTVSGHRRAGAEEEDDKNREPQVPASVALCWVVTTTLRGSIASTPPPACLDQVGMPNMQVKPVADVIVACIASQLNSTHATAKLACGS